jgi:hypothetical protein
MFSYVFIVMRGTNFGEFEGTALSVPRCKQKHSKKCLYFFVCTSAARPVHYIWFVPARGTPFVCTGGTLLFVPEVVSAT